MLGEGNDECGNVRHLREYAERKQWEASQFLLAEDEEEAHAGAENNKADDRGRVPRKFDPAETNTEKEHYQECKHAEAPRPVDRLQPLNHACLWIMDFKSENEQHKSGRRRVAALSRMPNATKGAGQRYRQARGRYRLRTPHMISRSPMYKERWRMLKRSEMTM